MLDDEVKVKFVCKHHRCNSQMQEFEKVVKKYQVGLLAIWFHSSHEGHHFEYYENDQLILG